MKKADSIHDDVILNVAYLKLAASSDQKPSFEGFRRVALQRGYSEREFREWAKNKREWRHEGVDG